MATHIGTNCCPVVKFYIGRGEDRSFPPEFKTIAEDAELAQFASENGPRQGATSHWVHAFARAFHDYLERIKLHATFTDNQYGFIPHFIWSTEEAVREERMKIISTASDTEEDTDSGVSVE